MNQTASSPQVSVIVPLYNEEENVPILQAELRAALRAIDHEFSFVDDGSADHTGEGIQDAPNTRQIRFEKNAGQSAAIHPVPQARRGALGLPGARGVYNGPAEVPNVP